MVARPVNEQQLRAAVSGSGPDRLFEVTWSRGRPGNSGHGVRLRTYRRASNPLRPRDDPVAGYLPAHATLGAGRRAVVVDRTTTRGVLVVATRGAMGWRGRTSPTWRARRCGAWCGRRRPNIPAGSCSSIPMRPWMMRRSPAVLAAGEPQVLVRGGAVYTARVRGSRAVDGLLVPPGDGPWRLGMSSAGTFENLRLEPVPNADAPLEPG